MIRSELFQKINYTANIDYLVSNYIREYDLSKANINILLRNGVINKADYDYYASLDRMTRQRIIGIMIRDVEGVGEILKAGIIEAKKEFFDANDISDHEVLSIKNDAVYLINKVAKYTEFGNIEFKEKNLYTSYFKILKKEYYYYFNSITGEEKLDIKGITDDRLVLHKDYFMEFLLVVFNTLETSSIDEALEIIQTFYNRYINLELDLEYYREFNPESLYNLKPISRYKQYKVLAISKDQKDMLDISHNQKLIMELYKIVSSIYFQKHNIKT